MSSVDQTRGARTPRPGSSARPRPFWKRLLGIGAPPKKKTKSTLREWTEMIITLAVFAVFVRMFMFQIPSGSMEDTLLIGDYIFVNRALYGFQVPLTDNTLPEIRSPEVGDVIVFKYPPDPRQNFIKRIVGAPGDVVEIKNRVVFRNSEPVDESFVKHTSTQMLPPSYQESNIDPPRAGNKHNYGPVTVPQGQYFVMGDNRDNSLDSRYWGFVPEEYVKGKAVFIYWSWDKSNWFLPRPLRIGRLIR